MNIALIGYGRMGHEIEKIAVSRGHNVVLKIDVNNPEDLNAENLKDVDVAIEFTIPTSAVDNYKTCFNAGVSVVSGTTGWLAKWDEVTDCCKKSNVAFFYTSNFSLGVNLFFEINRNLAELISPFTQYKAEVTEVHHTKKLDAPSGTAISLANDIIESIPSLKEWKLVDGTQVEDSQLPITAVREGDVPGIHTIKYDSDVDFIEITHSAKNRKGLALGAVLAAEYSMGKKGLLTMRGLLGLDK